MVSNYAAAFTNQTDELAKIRRTLISEMKLGQNNRDKSRAATIDLVDTCPVPRSTYRAKHPQIDIQLRLIEAKPQFPVYALRFQGDSTQKTADLKMAQSKTEFKRRKITITEPKHVKPKTNPLSADTKAKCTATTKQTNDKYVDETLYARDATGLDFVTIDVPDRRCTTAQRNASTYQRPHQKPRSDSVEPPFASTYATSYASPK